MKTTIKQISILLVAGILVIGGVILAGSLTPITGSPEATYVSLNDIFDKLTTGATTTEKSFTPTLAPAPTMHTLSEIFEAIYDIDVLQTVEPNLIAGNIATGTSIFGVEGSLAGAPVTVWSTSSYITTYNCSMYDNLAGTPLSAEDPATLCGYDSNCVWTGTACTGTPSGLSTITWYAGTLACYNSPEGSLPAGTWRLPDVSQLLGRLSDEFVTLTQPQVFDAGTAYWSSSAYASYQCIAWGAFSGFGNIGNDFDVKSNPYSLARCLH
jgi:hypothetical protein